MDILSQLNNWTGPSLLTAPEAARIIRVSESQMYTLARDGVIASIRIGKTVRIPFSDFQAWVETLYSDDIATNPDIINQSKGPTMPAKGQTKTPTAKPAQVTAAETPSTRCPGQPGLTGIPGTKGVCPVNGCGRTIGFGGKGALAPHLYPSGK